MKGKTPHLSFFKLSTSLCHAGHVGVKIPNCESAYMSLTATKGLHMQGSGVGSEGSRLEARVKSHKSAVAIT